jgi:predicted nucleic acid-binding protein
MYSLDTSVFMDWQARYYPPDIFKSMITKVDELIANGQCSSVDLVKEEIDAVGTPELRAWAKNHPALFVALDPLVQVEAASIESRYPDLMDPKSPYQSADAYVIALAKVKGGTVVSQETSAAEKRSTKRTHYIPDVCRDLGIPCINLLGLMRREKWNF